MDSAMDLSLRNSLSPAVPTPSSESLNSTSGGGGVQIVKPIPRPPWSILWYQNLWSGTGGGDCETGKTLLPRSTERSSFTVLNSLSTNTVSSSGNFNFANFAEEQQYRHFQFQSEPVATFTAAQFKPRQRADNLVELSPEDDENESDNSENIVVTGTSHLQSITKSPSAISDTSESDFHSHHHGRSHQPTVLDIACCDGPVQFKRISNPNFALTVEHNNEAPAPVPTKTRKKSEPCPESSYSKECVETRVSNSAFSLEAGKRYQISQQHQPHQPSSSTSSHNNKRDEDGELNQEISASSNNSPLASAATVTTHKSYLCIYCNQSFKSLFCYQKHKKRHLNPVSVDITTTSANSTSYRGGGSGPGTNNRRSSGGTGGGYASAACASGGGAGGGGGGGGIVGLLPENAKAKTKDLNVQFFPCKKCGSKFPSYYFVHKHRKICH